MRRPSESSLESRKMLLQVVFSLCALFTVISCLSSKRKSLPPGPTTNPDHTIFRKSESIFQTTLGSVTPSDKLPRHQSVWKRTHKPVFKRFVSVFRRPVLARSTVARFVTLKLEEEELFKLGQFGNYNKNCLQRLMAHRNDAVDPEHS
ncbi:hypothetical protein L596_029331 [Steinernema carpocapsae]|uniref:Uncharacterized protein n=1 Tax=Steinernema carpocapsae TaxID=34508 RepID=A0A4V5ZXG0_STECR|nr:hypothetical protein L596_029331 [Steinernema carpocapsae]